jgi:hypothetical protein
MRHVRLNASMKRDSGWASCGKGAVPAGVVRRELGDDAPVA